MQQRNKIAYNQISYRLKECLDRKLALININTNFLSKLNDYF